MNDPSYFKFPTLVIGDTYGPFYLRPYMSADGSVYPAQNVTLISEVRTDTIQNNGLLLLTLCNSIPTQTPPNKPNPNGYWFWILSASAAQTKTLLPGEYRIDVTLVYPDGTRQTRIQGAISIIGGSNG